MLVSQAILELGELDPQAHIAMTYWSKADILARAEDLEVDLPDEVADQIVEDLEGTLMQSSFDDEWEVIDDTIEMYEEQQEALREAALAALAGQLPGMSTWAWRQPCFNCGGPGPHFCYECDCPSDAVGAL